MVQNITFNSGETSKVISITIADDGVAEDDESFEVFLKPLPDSPDVVISQPSVAVGTIIDNNTISMKFYNEPYHFYIYVCTFILYIHTTYYMCIHICCKIVLLCN